MKKSRSATIIIISTIIAVVVGIIACVCHFTEDDDE